MVDLLRVEMIRLVDSALDRLTAPQLDLPTVARMVWEMAETEMKATKAEARKQEEVRKALEAHMALTQKKQEEAAARAAAAQAADEARAARKAEEAKAAAEAKQLEHEQRLARKNEETRQLAEKAEKQAAVAAAKRKAEEAIAARKADEAKAAAAARAADEAAVAARKAEEARAAADAKKQEEVRKALEAHEAARRRKEEEEARLAKRREEEEARAARKAEEAKAAAEAKQLEHEQRLARKNEETRQLAEKAEKQAAVAAAKRKAEEAIAARKADEAKAAAAARAADEDAQLAKRREEEAAAEFKQPEYDRSLPQKAEQPVAGMGTDASAAEGVAGTSDSEQHVQGVTAHEQAAAAALGLKDAATSAVTRMMELVPAPFSPEAKQPRRASSTAGKLSLHRLERSHSRVSNVKRSGDSEEPDHSGGLDYQVTSQEHDPPPQKSENAASSSSAGATAQLSLVDALGTASLAKAKAWLQPWQAHSPTCTELAANCKVGIGLTADCLALDEGGDGTFVGIGADGDGRSVCVFSGSGALSRTLTGHSSEVSSVAVQGDWVASGAKEEGVIRLWSLRSGECVKTLSGCEREVNGLALHGDLLLSGEGGMKKPTVRLWSISTGQVRSVFTEHTAPVWSVALGDAVAVSASHDSTARCWPTAAGASRSLATLTHPDWVLSVRIDCRRGENSPQGTGGVAVTGCGDGMVRIWMLATFACVRTIDTLGPEDSHWRTGSQLDRLAKCPVLSVRLLGSVLATGGSNGNVKIWSLADDANPCIATLPHSSSVRGLALSHQGYLATLAGKQVKQLQVWKAG